MFAKVMVYVMWQCFLSLEFHVVVGGSRVNSFQLPTPFSASRCGEESMSLGAERRCQYMQVYYNIYIYIILVGD